MPFDRSCVRDCKNVAFVNVVAPRLLVSSANRRDLLKQASQLLFLLFIQSDIVQGKLLSHAEFFVLHSGSCRLTTAVSDATSTFISSKGRLSRTLHV
jgi:hypothetical protein